MKGGGGRGAQSLISLFGGLPMAGTQDPTQSNLAELVQQPQAIRAAEGSGGQAVLRCQRWDVVGRAFPPLRRSEPGRAWGSSSSFCLT